MSIGIVLLYIVILVLTGLPCPANWLPQDIFFSGGLHPTVIGAIFTPLLVRAVKNRSAAGTDFPKDCCFLIVRILIHLPQQSLEAIKAIGLLIHKKPH